MNVNIDNLNIALPVAKSASDPVALEIPGLQAQAQYPELVLRLPDGSLQLTAPTRGASSKSPHRTRCEWKEPIHWSLSSATEHVNHQLMKVTQVNSAQKVVVAQVHVKNDDSPLLKVFWQEGKLTLGFRQNFNQTAPVNSTVLDNVPLGADFDILVLVTSSLMLSVQASCNGRTSSLLPMPLDASWAVQTFNFHGGVYNQVDYSDATLPTDASVCVIKDLQIWHI
ncbi:polysaccharide lyase family 7 protein [Pseudomonas sp. MT3]